MHSPTPSPGGRRERWSSKLYEGVEQSTNFNPDAAIIVKAERPSRTAHFVALGRAWRMPEFSCVGVFEVDHPAAQGDKRTHLAELPPAPGIVSFVSIDFERESLGVALERAGHDRASPTCWIWEGVVMYLTRDE